jgi:saccharopine dehydrogenase-like NADP-dependent oxidoreductase
MKKITLLGAGHIGRAIAKNLHGCGDYQLSIYDARQEAAQSLELYGEPFGLDTDDVDALSKAVEGADAVVNALPYAMAIPAAWAAKGAGAHYFDLTEDRTATRVIRAMAEGAQSAFMPQCGLAPGFVGICAHHIAKEFDAIDEVKLRVGALPEFPTNALKYNLTWSVDGLVNEYCHPCEAIRDGRLIEALPLEGLEHFALDGTQYEAFNTSGGLGTLCESLAGKARNLDYKTVRYPGHRDLMAFLLEDLRFKDDQEALKQALRRSMPSTMQDVVLVFVTVSGTKKGLFVQEAFARKVFASVGKDAQSAIQITTAAGICAAVDLFFEGKLPSSGFIAQERVELDDFLSNRFGKAYAPCVRAL